MKYFDLEEGRFPDGSRFDPPAHGIAEREGRRLFEVVIDREQRWSRHLEQRCWPIIPTVAEMLLNGSTDVDEITATVRRLWDAAGNPTAFLDRPVASPQVQRSACRVDAQRSPLQLRLQSTPQQP